MIYIRVHLKADGTIQWTGTDTVDIPEDLLGPEEMAFVIQPITFASSYNQEDTQNG